MHGEPGQGDAEHTGAGEQVLAGALRGGRLDEDEADRSQAGDGGDDDDDSGGGAAGVFTGGVGCGLGRGHHRDHRQP